MTTLPMEGPHWSFALGLYGKAGVSDACLLLQDRVGVDINVLLFALFAAMERGVALNSGDLQNIDAAVAAWRSDIVLPLRAIRRRLKNGPKPASNDITEALRTRIKKAEINAEQIEQSVLALWFERRFGQQEPREEVDPGNVLRNVVDYFAARNGTPASVATGIDVQEAIKTLLRSMQIAV